MHSRTRAVLVSVLFFAAPIGCQREQPDTPGVKRSTTKPPPSAAQTTKPPTTSVARPELSTDREPTRTKAATTNEKERSPKPTTARAAKATTARAAKPSTQPPPRVTAAQASRKRKELLDRARKIAGTRRGMPDRSSTKHVYFRDTENGITVSAEEARDLLREGARANPGKRPLIKNPKTGKYTGVFGLKCDKCGAYFPLPEKTGNILPGSWRDECPCCGYSRQRERVVQAALRQKKAGTWDPDKVPPFIREAVEEYEAKQKEKDKSPG